MNLWRNSDQDFTDNRLKTKSSLLFFFLSWTEKEKKKRKEGKHIFFRKGNEKGKR